MPPGSAEQGGASSTEPRIGDALPRASEARIDPRKLHSYALSRAHQIGGPKARRFEAVLAIGAGDWEHLHNELLRALPGGRIDRITPGAHTTTYGVRLTITGRNSRRAEVVTAWKLVDGIPHLVTAYVARERRCK